jgi:hypothetical protein
LVPIAYGFFRTFEGAAVRLQIARKKDGLRLQMVKKRQDEKFKNLQHRTKKILSDSNYEKECYPLNDLLLNVARTEANVERKVVLYKWFAFLLLMAIPIISAFLSVIVAEDANGGTQHAFGALLPYAPYFSFTLTLLTILASIFKPGERFQTACFMSIKISHFGSDILAGLEGLSPVDDKKLLEFSHSKREEFERYQEQLVGLFLPEAVRK